jgi:transcriptional regulator with XRE-family HTH domain
MDWTDAQRAAFADLWRLAREQMGLKQYQVAERTGVSASTISSLERGPYEGMRAIDLWRLSTFFGLPCNRAAQVLGMDLDTGPADEQPLGRYTARLLQMTTEQQDVVMEVLDALVSRYSVR